MKARELRVRDGETMVDRVEPEHGGARLGLDLRVMRAQGCNVVGRARTAECRCHQYC